MSEKRSVGIRELQRDTSEIVERVTRTGRPTFVTNRGESVAVVYPVDAEALEEYALANAPEFVRAMTEADGALAEGMTNKQIAEALSISPTTVRGHIAVILRKLGGTQRETAVKVRTGRRVPARRARAVTD